MAPTKITEKTYTDFVGRPVWYQIRRNQRSFGWALLREATPYTVRLTLADGSYDWVNWNNIDLYDSPHVRKLCADCRNYVRRCGTEPAHCMIHSAGQARNCSGANDFRDFTPADPEDESWRWGRIKDFIRALKLAGWWNQEVAK